VGKKKRSAAQHAIAALEQLLRKSRRQGRAGAPPPPLLAPEPFVDEQTPNHFALRRQLDQLRRQEQAQLHRRQLQRADETTSPASLK
jgi:hypothetical protein